MNAAILIASRELREKSRLFLTALAMAVIPFIASVMPAARVTGDPNIVALLAGMLSFAMCVGIATVLGVTTIGRELSDGRLSFYFSKPIPPAAIWVGKAAASLIAALLCYGIIAIPAMLYSGDVWTSTWLTGGDVVWRFTVAGAVGMFFLMHALATIVRSRSPLAALDFVLAVGAGFAVTMILRPLRWAEASALVTGVGTFILIAVVVVLAIAPAWQLSRGRTDRRRSHAALSKAVWTGFAIVLLMAAGFVGWIVSAGPEDLDGELHVAQSPTTGWMFLSGNTRSVFKYHANFLIGPDGQFQRARQVWWGAEFSRDGRVAAWLQPVSTRRLRQMELYTRDLTRPDAKPVPTGIHARFAEFVLSEDGSRVAIAEDENLSVHDLKTGRLLASARIFERNATTQFFFVSPNVVRTIQTPRTSVKSKKSPVLMEFDVRQRRVTKTGVVEPVETAIAVATPDGSKLLFRKEGLLVDGRTGATLGRFGPSGGGLMILRDGTVLTTSGFGTPGRVTIHRPAAAPVDIPLPGMTYAYVRGEIAPGKVVVQAGSSWVSGNNAVQARVFIIDTATAVVERVDDKTRAPLMAWPSADPRPLPIDTGRPLAAFNEAGKLVMWNPLTGEKTPPAFSQ